METTLVEFPAYEARLDEVRSALRQFGFDPSSLHVTGMLDEIHSEAADEPAPAGAAYRSLSRVKRRVTG
jgi:hypothetical protein